jgi:4a-hydroxytetrahydrobiopterin dehydratase
MKRLTDAEISEALEQLPSWSIHQGKLHRKYQFADFAHAFGFMTTCALIIERLNHHPDWCNVYNRVTVDLFTHDAGGITHKDVELATHVENIAQRLL